MMKRYYQPEIQIKSIESEDIMDNVISIPVYSDTDDFIIEDGSEILSNTNSVWDE